MIRIRFEHTSNILCDNLAVIFNTQFPSSNLKKKHNAVAYHRCREVMAAKIARSGYVNTKYNLSDIMTKPKGPMDYSRLLGTIMYGKVPETVSTPVRGSCTMELDNMSKYLVSSPIVREITRDSSFPDTTTREQDKDHLDEKPSPWERAQMETGLDTSNPIQDGTDYQPFMHEMETHWKDMDSIGT